MKVIYSLGLVLFFILGCTPQPKNAENNDMKASDEDALESEYFEKQKQQEQDLLNAAAASAQEVEAQLEEFFQNEELKIEIELIELAKTQAEEEERKLLEAAKKKEAELEAELKKESSTGN